MGMFYPRFTESLIGKGIGRHFAGFEILVIGDLIGVHSIVDSSCEGL